MASDVYEITKSIINRRGEAVAAFVGEAELPEQYLPSELDKFWKDLEALDPGGDHKGSIWFKSGCWAYLNKYRGEWLWDFVAVPPIPERLKK